MRKALRRAVAVAATALVLIAGTPTVAHADPVPWYEYCSGWHDYGANWRYKACVGKQGSYVWFKAEVQYLGPTGSGNQDITVEYAGYRNDDLVGAWPAYGTPYTQSGEIHTFQKSVYGVPGSYYRTHARNPQAGSQHWVDSPTMRF